MALTDNLCVITDSEKNREKQNQKRENIKDFKFQKNEEMLKKKQNKINYENRRE